MSTNISLRGFSVQNWVQGPASQSELMPYYLPKDVQEAAEKDSLENNEFDLEDAVAKLLQLAV
jgi:hypothetical protein